ncbi:MAG: carbohydrate kinase [Rhizobiaceae bacterium]|nr:carbohydrate kinase [Rhizobiaceae bacterium]
MIVCCGEALIDMLPRKNPDGLTVYLPKSGGSVFNTAIALGRLDVPVGFCSGLSTDFFGAELKAALDASNVDLRYIHSSDLPTTLAFVQLTGGHASYLFYDENSAGRMLSEDDLPEFQDDVAALHFSGISLVPEPCGSTYEGLMRREKDKRVILLDPNLRRPFIKDPTSHRARLRRMIAMADVVKLSDEDLEWFGEDGSVEDIAQRWLQLGPALVVLTAGDKGLVAYAASGKVEVAAPEVNVVDTVGAGDTVNAGLLAGFHDAGVLTKDAIRDLSAADIRTALELASQAAAITVSRAGANPPRRSELAQSA